MEQLGRYQILGELGRGAMGVVYRALDPSIGREVALKTIRLTEFEQADQRRKQRDRLFREARSAGILSHPAIVTIFDVGEQGETAYIAMEFVVGSTLDQLLTAQPPLQQERMLSLLRQTAEALDYAHQHGIVHRDIKPANIMVKVSGLVKITDFGIAKISAAEQLTQAGLIVGTPNYMSPEQVQGKPVSGRSDQYSLAVIAYEMLTGERPFTADQLPTLVYKIVCEEAVSPQRLNPSLGSEVSSVLTKGLSKEAEERHASCTAFLMALEAACARTPHWRILPRGGSQNLPTIADEMAETTANPLAVSSPESLPAPPAREESPPTKKSGFLIAASIIALLAIIGGVYFWKNPDGAPRAKIEFGAGPDAGAFAETKPPAPASNPPAVKPEEAMKPEAVKPETVKPEEAKVAAPPEAPPSATPVHTPTPSTVPIEVLVRTEPSGARVLVDGVADAACTTPCTVKTTSGKHVLSFSRDGFKDMNRDVQFAASPAPMPIITLASALGVVMLQSEPSGATILVNDQKWASPTPAQLRLPPGKYKIAVEKGELKGGDSVEIKDGDFRHLSIQLTPPAN